MIRYFLWIILPFLPLAAMSPSERTPFLGVKTLEYFDSTRNRPVVVELWYPTDFDQANAMIDDGIWVHPSEVRDAPLQKVQRKRPLILMSHGHKGGRRDSSWLAETLVKSGYIVAAIDHYGDMRVHFDLLSSVRFWDRAVDFTFIIDQLEKNEALKADIDFDKIGFVGYSLGGMTGLSLAGAEASNVKEAVLKLNRYALRDLIERFDFSPAEKSFAEPRIKAMLLLCPAVFVYSSGALGKITLPIGLIAAEKDEVLPFKEHAGLLIDSLKLKRIKLLGSDGSHYTVMNHIAKEGQSALHKDLCSERVETSRSIHHKEVGSFANDFFKEAFGDPRLAK